MARTPPATQPGVRRPLERATIVKIVTVLVTVFVIVPLVFVCVLLTGSEPKLDGTLKVPGLKASVSIARDSLGIPTIVAATRADLAYGLGFAHGQDRFFEMDLSRRLAAGELSEIFGEIALAQDREARLFRFRSVAQAALAQAPPEQRAQIDAYASGVNAGLASLRNRPWEYIALQATPAQWQAEDTMLIPYAMWWDLQHNSIRREKVRRAINMKLGGAECEGGWKCALSFFYPRGTSWDSPNAAGEAKPAEPIHMLTSEELDLRATHTQTPDPGAGREALVGSNGWVIGGANTDGGGALVASDMHLGLRVPNIWYRARMQLRPAGVATATLDLNGVTLPGAHVLVAGSNGHIAWGFTNSYGDWVDLTFAPCTAVDDKAVRTAAGTIELTTVTEKISVKGKRLHNLLAVSTGPDGILVEAQPSIGRCWFARWIATVPEATNFSIGALETATTTAQAVDLAPTIGIPHQNLMIGDREGHIAWTIGGRIPDTSDAKLRLTGQAPWTTAANHPRLMDPAAGRVWTANARPIDDGAAEALIGGDEAAFGAEYDLGARAKQIHDDLAGIAHATPLDMLKVQTDDNAVFLTRWRDLLIQLLDDVSVRDHPRRAELKKLLNEWNARATPDSVGYRLVRTFRDQTERSVWRMLLGGLDVDALDAPPPSQFEGALWELVTQRPAHLLSAGHDNWKTFLLEQVDQSVSENVCPQLERCTWGSLHPVRVRHPMAGSIPILGSFLNMPAIDVPGDHDMPRVQDGAFGASERFAVAPGREAEGYLHIAGGQSGHPLSPYYKAGYSEWAEGKPLPFLPGAAEHTLTLEPASTASTP
ncbi:MAG: penicillin acylase family protein [Gammaproteobacteria bacterium]